ncbi:molybdopterin synthase subunit MoaE /molybdopterin synthase subunit MoaD [Terriglobus roseus]|uniref:Molybdopterin synthase catalytic subunit n=2 Tax=Terriglobus roseus TaxID=392734 RepID=A0A1G7KWG1_9BACT|nr:molybdopterin synthase subunit MoaE /molybdopterin synthase subunit MoaD [Terriglobus roseus]
MLNDMQLRVLFFGVLRDHFGPEEVLEQFPGTNVGDLVRYYRVLSPELGPLWEKIAVAVNQQYATASQELSKHDEVALLPPVSGGAPSPIELTHDVIDAKKITDALKADEDGAFTVFDGIVRNNTRGRQTLFLEYSAYDAMALAQMQQLAAEAIAKFGVRDVAVVHRLGRLEVGETSILIAVASAHRGAAFEACRWLIDTIKKQVPIWKKEHFVDGAVWVDGEPFPEAIVPTV